MSIPLYRFDLALIDWITQRYALRLEHEGRARIVRHKKGTINRVILRRRASDLDHELHVRDYKGQKYSFRQDLDSGRECWKFRPLCGGHSETRLAPPEIRPIFLAVLIDCMRTV